MMSALPRHFGVETDAQQRWNASHTTAYDWKDTCPVAHQKLTAKPLEEQAKKGSRYVRTSAPPVFFMVAQLSLLNPMQTGGGGVGW